MHKQMTIHEAPILHNQMLPRREEGIRKDKIIVLKKPGEIFERVDEIRFLLQGQILRQGGMCFVS